jgi:nitrogenase molybdenum-iron protein beta chain
MSLQFEGNPDITEQFQTTCAIGGLYTALAMNNVMPVLHCGPGCQAQTRAVLAGSNGAQNSYPLVECVIPCTDFGEADVVFGGAERLRKIVDHAQRAYKAELLLLFSGCTSEIVGDDLEEVARSFEGSDVPVLHVEAAGFRGNNLYGHHQVWSALIEGYLQPAAAVELRQVNVFGIVPFYDTYWTAQLDELAKLLTAVGLKPNIFYGRGKSLDDVKKIPAAEFNLLLGPWVDLQTVEKLEERFGTPFFHYPAHPIGPTETNRFLRELAAYANLDTERVEAVIKDGEELYYDYMNRGLWWIYGCKRLPKHYIINSSGSMALSLHRYLANDLGLLPDSIFIPEDIPAAHHERILKYFQDVELGGREVPVTLTADGGLAATVVREKQFDKGSLFMFSTAWDVLLCRRLQIAHLPVSPPNGSRMIGLKHYFGYTGGVNLFSDYYGKLSEMGGLL